MSSTSGPESGRGNSVPQSETAFPERRLLYLLLVVGMSLLILVLLYLILWVLAGILQPLFVAIFICYLIVPAHRWLVARRIPSSVSYIIIVGGFLTVIFTAGNMAFQGVKALSEEMPTHIERIRKGVDDLNLRFRETVEGLLPQSALSERDVEEEESATPEEGGTSSEASTETEAGNSESEEGNTNREPFGSGGGVMSERAFPSDVEAAPPWISTQTLVEWGQAMIDPLFGLVTSTLVVMFYLVFLLAELAGFQRRLLNAFGEVRARRVMEVVNSINTAISHYIVVKTMTSFIVAFLSTVILTLFDVRYAVIWGILTFFANFIPYVGSMVAVILPVLIHFALAGPSFSLLVLLVLLISTQVTIGSYLEPRMVGRKLGISPLIILLGLAFWGMLWGIPGMVLSAPLMVAAKIVLENIDQTRPVARLISNV